MNRFIFKRKKQRILINISRSKREFEKIKAKMEKDNKDSDEILDLHGEYMNSIIDYEKDLEVLISEWYKYQCHKLDIPTNYGKANYWEKTLLGNQYILTDEGRAKLRSEIRNEVYEKQRISLPWVSMIIALIAALTGILAVISSR